MIKMLLKDNEHTILLTSVNKYVIVRISRMLASSRVLSLITVAVIYYKISGDISVVQ